MRQQIVDALRQSLWFVPAIWIAACGTAAFGIIAIDRAVPELAARIPLIFGGGPEGARGLLSAIASSMITVVGVVFSITIVALQLASSQYSPRVLRNFMRDRPSQLTLGSFIGAFVYSLLVLRTVRGPGEGREEFVPVLATTGAVVLAAVAVVMLVFFVHHIATRMQVSHITAAVTRETLSEIDRQAQAAGDTGAEPVPAAPTGPSRTIASASSGYLQYVEIDGLQELAERADVVIRVVQRPGEWVHAHAPLFRVWGAADDEAIAEEARRHVSVGDERVVYQDPEFGIQQLVDIAVRALSPGINDPTTACNALHHIVDILVAAGRSKVADGGGLHPRNDRVHVPTADYAVLLRTAFEEIQHFGREIPSVARAVSTSLRTLESAVAAERRPAVAEARRQFSEPSTG